MRDDDVDLREVLHEIWLGRWLMAAVAGVCVACSGAYALLATKIYRTEALVQPQEDSQSKAGLGGLLGQFGGLAELTGVSLGGGSDRAVAVATLESRIVVEGFIRDKGLLPKLYPSEWDPDANTWDDPDDAPTIWEAYTDFTNDVLAVSEDKTTGLLTVAIEWSDAAEAQQWATELIARTNAHLRTRAIQEAEANLAYLQQQLRTIGQVELQRSLYGLVETELKKLMLAKGGEEFALKTIDPAVVAIKPHRPKRLVIVIVGLVGGVLLGALAVVLRKTWLAREWPE